MKTICKALREKHNLDTTYVLHFKRPRTTLALVNDTKVTQRSVSKVPVESYHRNTHLTN